MVRPTLHATLQINQNKHTLTFQIFAFILLIALYLINWLTELITIKGFIYAKQ